MSATISSPVACLRVVFAIIVPTALTLALSWPAASAPARGRIAAHSTFDGTATVTYPGFLYIGVAGPLALLAMRY